MQFKTAKEKLDAANAKFTRAHENRLRKTDELLNARVTRHLLMVDKYCLEFIISFISQKSDGDRETFCMEQVEFAEDTLTGLHDALLRNVTPLFNPAMAMKTKSNIIWQYWSNILNTLGEGFTGGEELLSTIDRYLHLWCENRVPPRPCEDAIFRQMVDTEWNAVRKGLSEFREFLRKRKDRMPGTVSEDVCTGMEQPKKAEAVKRAKSTAAKPVKPQRKVLLDVHRKISKFGYKVEGDRKTIHFGEKTYRLTAPIVVKKVNEMIKALSENGKDVYVPFPVKVLNQFHREPYASFLRDCIKRKTKQDSDPDAPIFMPEARLRVKGEM